MNSKINKGEFLQIKAQLESIQKVDEMISMHRSIGHDLMYSQYEYKKLVLFQELLGMLVESSLNAEKPHAFPFIVHLLEKHYPTSFAAASPLQDAKLLADAIQSLDKSEFVLIQSYLESIQKVDDMIAMHRATENDFMYSQYEYHKLGIFKELLVLLIESSLNIEKIQTFHLIVQLMKKHYPASLSPAVHSPEVQPLADLLQSFAKSKATPYSIPAAQVLVAAEEKVSYGKHKD